MHYLLEYSSAISSRYSIVMLNNKNLMLEVLPMMEDHVLNKYLSHFLISIKCNGRAPRIHMNIVIDATCKA